MRLENSSQRAAHKRNRRRFCGGCMNQAHAIKTGFRVCQKENLSTNGIDEFMKVPIWMIC